MGDILNKGLGASSGPGRQCATCGSDEFLADGFGKGGLNDVCRPCFYIWYDGIGPCQNPEHSSQKPHIHPEDIGEYSRNARAAGTWPFNAAEFAPTQPGDK